MKIVSVQQMREIEQGAVALGVSLDDLQRNAADAIARELERLLPRPDDPLLFLAGPGNNGRDALIAAAILRRRGVEVRVYLAPKAGSEDVLADLRERGARVYSHSGERGLPLLVDWLRESAAVVDGLLGIGIKGAAREPIATLIETVSREAAAHPIPVVAVDLPSGIDADTGDIPGAAIRATHTISLGCVKEGLLKFPAASLVGKLLPVGIGLPDATLHGVARELLTAGDLAGAIPGRPLDAHKGTFGRVLVVAGSEEFVGAGVLAGTAAARAGCGLVTLAIPAWQRAAIAARLPEATYLPLVDGDGEAAATANAEAIAAAIPGCSALLVGPGLGRGAYQARLVTGVLEAAGEVPGLAVIVDADGLNALADQPDWWGNNGPGWVVTPHPGEMGRLLGRSAAEVNARRWETAEEAARAWSQVVVLKGAFTVVAAPSGRTWINGAALPALATAGTGDVLSGLIAGLAAQGASPLAAARVGVYVHAAAEEALNTRRSDRLIASDLLETIPIVLSRLAGGTHHTGKSRGAG